MRSVEEGPRNGHNFFMLSDHAWVNSPNALSETTSRSTLSMISKASHFVLHSSTYLELTKV